MVAFTSMARLEAQRHSMGGGRGSSLGRLFTRIASSKTVGRIRKAVRKRRKTTTMSGRAVTRGRTLTYINPDRRLVPYTGGRAAAGRMARLRASMAWAGAKLKTLSTAAAEGAAPTMAKASASYKRLKRATSTKNIPADVKGLKRLRNMNKKQLAAALFKMGGKGTFSLAAMFGATAAIDALGTALASGSPEPVIEDTATGCWTNSATPQRVLLPARAARQPKWPLGC